MPRMEFCRCNRLQISFRVEMRKIEAGVFHLRDIFSQHAEQFHAASVIKNLPVLIRIAALPSREPRN